MKRNLLSIVAICAMSFGINAQIQGYSVGQTVADFTVTDTDGNTHTLSDYTNAGQWVVLDFFFTTCGPCQATAPYFNELHEKYGCNAADLVCITVNTGQDNNAAVVAYENTYGGAFSHSPAVGSEGGAAAVNTAFNPAAYPTYCLVGADMKLKHADIWPIGSVADFENAITGVGFNPAVTACSAAGLDDLTVAFNALTVYPNPASETTTIGVELDANTQVIANVYNMVGAIVATEVFNGVEGQNNFTLGTNDLENGQYILKVSFGNESETQVSLTISK